MRSYALVLVPLVGLCLLRPQIVPAQAIKTREPAPSFTQRNPFEAVPEPLHPPSPKLAGPTIEAIEFRGARRLPQSTLQALVVSRVGGAYDLETLRRDSQRCITPGASPTSPGKPGWVPPVP